MDNWFKTNISSPVINYLGKRKEESHFSKAPILIGGCGRSGTTFLLSVLSAHPGIFALPVETDAFTRWEERESVLKPVREDRFYRYLLTHRVPKTCERWCEKRPYNVRYIAEILRYFGPEVRFLHLVRDPRAVCTSQHPVRPGRYWISPERYIRDVNAGLVYQGHCQVHTVRYEDLVNDLPSQMRNICQFINEPVVPQMLNWHRYATVRKNKAWSGTVQEVYRHSLSSWKSPLHATRVRELMTFRDIRQLMDKLGYRM